MHKKDAIYNIRKAGIANTKGEVVKHMNDTRSTYLSIIIPIYNEEESIPHLHERLHNVLAQQDFSYEILYIDDGSSDTTFQQLSQLISMMSMYALYVSVAISDRQRRWLLEWNKAMVKS